MPSPIGTPIERRRGARRRAAATGTRPARRSADEPAAEAEHQRVERPEQHARLAADAAAPAHAAPHQRAARAARRAGSAIIVAAKPLPSAVCVTSGVKSTFVRRVERVVDLAGVEERVDQARARLRLVAPERGRVAEARRARPGGRSAGTGAAPSSRSAAASRSRACRRPAASRRSSRARARTRSRPGSPARRPPARRRPRGSPSPGCRGSSPSVAGRARSSASRRAASARPIAASSPQTNDSGNARSRQQRLEPETARVAVARRRASVSSVIGAESGAASEVDSISP